MNRPKRTALEQQQTAARHPAAPEPLCKGSRRLSAGRPGCQISQAGNTHHQQLPLVGKAPAAAAGPGIAPAAGSTSHGLLRLSCCCTVLECSCPARRPAHCFRCCCLRRCLCCWPLCLSRLLHQAAGHPQHLTEPGSHRSVATSSARGALYAGSPAAHPDAKGGAAAAAAAAGSYRVAAFVAAAAAAAAAASD